MTPRTLRLAATATLLGVACLLSACGVGSQPVVTVLPTDDVVIGASASPTPTPVPVPSASVVPGPVESDPPVSVGAGDCGGAPVVLDAGSRSLTISGDCPDVQVNGAAFQVDATQADIAVLTVSGDRLDVSLDRGGQVTIQGNDIAISASDVSSLTVRGDRNSVTASGSVGGVVFQGNDNAVRAATVGAVSDDGDRNTIG